MWSLQVSAVTFGTNCLGKVMAVLAFSSWLFAFCLGVLAFSLAFSSSPLIYAWWFISKLFQALSNRRPFRRY